MGINDLLRDGPLPGSSTPQPLLPFFLVRAFAIALPSLLTICSCSGSLPVLTARQPWRISRFAKSRNFHTM
jgi:hypothetical protein